MKKINCLEVVVPAVTRQQQLTMDISLGIRQNGKHIYPELIEKLSKLTIFYWEPLFFSLHLKENCESSSLPLPTDRVCIEAMNISRHSLLSPSNNSWQSIPTSAPQLPIRRKAIIQKARVYIKCWTQAGQGEKVFKRGQNGPGQSYFSKQKKELPFPSGTSFLGKFVPCGIFQHYVGLALFQAAFG